MSNQTPELAAGEVAAIDALLTELAPKLGIETKPALRKTLIEQADKLLDQRIELTKGK